MILQFFENCLDKHLKLLVFFFYLLTMYKVLVFLNLLVLERFQVVLSSRKS